MFRFLVLLSLLCCAVATTKNNTYGQYRLTTYVVDWEIPKTIDWKQIDHIAYAFAEPDSNGTLKSFTSNNLKSLASKAHENNVAVSISVGGWSGSKHFSSLVKSNSTRSTLINNIMSIVNSYKLDGVNIDWEYPNDPNGMSCNEKNSNDTANYLLFIKDLRKALDTQYQNVHKLITLAVGTSVFMDQYQKPIKKLDKDWAKNVDSFYIMAYDVSGSWEETAGPNAPLKASPNYSTCVIDGVNAWYNAGIPKKQLVVGVPFYGLALRTYNKITPSTGPYVKLANNSAIKGDSYDEKSADDCPGSVASYSGSYQWRSIANNGIMSNSNGWTTYWDNTSTTPYAYHYNTNKYLSFDDSKSLKDKVYYVNNQSLGGVMVWSLEMDDSSHTLLHSLQAIRNSSCVLDHNAY